MDDIRNSVDEEIERLHQITRKDFENVIKKYNISNSFKSHENDALSVTLWVESMKKFGDDSPVLFYKKQGDEQPPFNKEDFILILMTNYQNKMAKKFGNEKICVDSTHGTNAYDFMLTTLLTLDEFCAGVPVAFCISNRTDEITMNAFFDNVKRKTGVLKVKVFMSDDYPAYYNSWKNIMTPAEHYLLCIWHVIQNWEKNMSKIKIEDKQAEVFEQLMILIKQTEKTKFHRLMQKMINIWNEDPDAKKFCEYFNKMYAKRPEQWAACYRGHLGLQTNMHLEAFHKTFKYRYLDGKQVKRVDKTVHMLMKFARDSMFSRLIKLTKKNTL